MGDHTHEKGEWMLSYRYMFMSMDGHRAGTQGLSTEGVFNRGFSSASTEMDMEMNMFGLMYAPTDRLTLMAMANYVRKDMTMEMNPHAAMHGGGAHGGHGASSSHSHSSEGFGDVTLGVLYKIFETENHHLHLNFGIGLPTAEVDHADEGVYQPYGMQSGTGTWDFKPGLTYLGQTKEFSWGAQLTGLIPLEDENNSGFSVGDAVNLTTWVARPLNDSFSVSARINYGYQDKLEGHYDGNHDHSAPPHFQQNYGGHVVDLGIGMNFFFQSGIFTGHRIAIEGLLPIYQNANGVGMDRDYSIIAGWQKAF
ncbi:transporter [Luteolibacter sp. AS25]|uniref:transporter n=1 Tax=Luteolibacter sp. AS25 TaxID=3135776 RepID=UPI00398BBC26